MPLQLWKGSRFWILVTVIATKQLFPPHPWLIFFFISTNPCPGNSDHMRVSPYSNLCKHLLKQPQWDSYPLLNWKLKAYKMPLSFALVPGIWFVARAWISLMHVWPENDGMFFPWVNVREQSLPETNVGGKRREASYLCSSFALLRDSPPHSNAVVGHSASPYLPQIHKNSLYGLWNPPAENKLRRLRK